MGGGGGGGGACRSYTLHGDTPCPILFTSHRLVGLVAKTSSSRAADLGSFPTFAVDVYPGRAMPVT